MTGGDTVTSVVGTTIIYNNYFEFWIILTPHRGERSLYGARCIICWDYDSDRRKGHILPASPRLRQVGVNLASVLDSSYRLSRNAGLLCLGDRGNISFCKRLRASSLANRLQIVDPVWSLSRKLSCIKRLD